METFVKNGIKYGVVDGKLYHLDEEEPCLAITHPESGIRTRGQILFADGSSRGLEGGSVYGPPVSGGQYPRLLPMTILAYWKARFEKAEADFQRYKRGITGGSYARSKEVLAELKRLKAVAKGCAKEIRKAERGVEVADPSYRERTEEDARIEAESQRRQQEFMQEVKNIELNV